MAALLAGGCAIVDPGTGNHTGSGAAGAASEAGGAGGGGAGTAGGMSAGGMSAGGMADGGVDAGGATAGAAGGGGVTAGSGGAAGGGATGGEVLYGDMEAGLSGDDLSRWHAARAALVKLFDDLCGDTLCEGDYWNLSHVTIGCSMSTEGFVKECVWVLGGSLEYVDGATGAFTVDGGVFPCTVPVGDSVETLLATLEQAPGNPLPSTGLSFYDALTECGIGPGDPVPPTTGTTYVELTDYLVAHGDASPWTAAHWTLSKAFGDACESTFCQGPWRNITALHLACAAEAATGQVSACLWTFGAANLHVVPEDGDVVASTEVLECPVTVSGPASEVVSAISGPDPVHAALPGAPGTLEQQLSGCL